MALPSAETGRTLHHQRRIDVEIYAREDGLWEVDARLTDTRTAAVRMASGTREAGDPIHDLLLRIVVDTEFNVVAAGSQPRSMPYPGDCDAHGDPYVAIAGLNLMRGFRHALRERLGGVRGCTHLSELALVLPTAVVQAFAGGVVDTHGATPDSPRPFQIDRCQALRSDGPVVLRHYPRWYRAPSSDPASVKPSSQTQPESTP